MRSKVLSLGDREQDDFWPIYVEHVQIFHSTESMIDRTPGLLDEAAQAFSNRRNRKCKVYFIFGMLLHSVSIAEFILIENSIHDGGIFFQALATHYAQFEQKK